MAESKQKPRKKQSKNAAASAEKKAANTKQTATSEVRDCLLNQRQMCESLSVTPPGFARWGVEPALRVGNRAYYSVRDVVDNRVEAALEKQRLERPGPLEGSDLNPVAEQARLAKEKADAQALKNSVTRGELIPAEAMGLVISKVATEMAAALDALPGQIKRIEPGLSATSLDKIKREIVRAQNAAAEVDRYLDEFVDVISTADEGD
ncbi:terminase small subunit [Microbulbifer sp. ARAS458-1]|uniref:terminase small subunit n=1 Tax=Microbulbifer sp. ARAS458-1 TaxID=3140242 RepID=UPI00387829B6